ncbi:beta-ketoacyl synthase [Tannerella sp.]|uniref:beta-ketoacyl-[acyl-carrier-protein] synthase family protein n=1 Tax=Tannerella sp. TaxID=2382127 RepID=UPI0026DBC359|nr:beta-ketoacyl synthase N-terminal-like domain-containing protein [Tannerella sp.]MDO4703789.1 beta-ketoacyl synthase N-terminal-like domain-containing protein [Tannerella sp.]
MTICTGDNIISSLGFTAEENYRNVKQGRTGLRLYRERFGLPEPFMASEIDDTALNAAFAETEIKYAPAAMTANYTKIEKASIVSVAGALKTAAIDASDKRVLFIFSTTKGNVFLLDEHERRGYEAEQVFLWRSAERIACFFGNTNPPLVVSNACISGAAAIIAAQRELRAGRYDHIIVVAADMLSRFVISGFQSFKALSQEVCKPFDRDRCGLNLGEAAATLIMTERRAEEIDAGEVVLTAGAVRNDANHISGPSRTGEGSYLALRYILEGIAPGEVAFVNAHGTATPYNDEMESIALTRAGLADIPVNSLKGYFGHTLGAAGVLESVISIRALREGIVLKTHGFETLGVTHPLRVASETHPTTSSRCVKMLSGFGGCNAALLFTKHIPDQAVER